MKLYFGVTTFKWLISPQEELYHGLTTFEWIFPLELLPSVNFRNRLIVVNNRLISINRIDN